MKKSCKDTVTDLRAELKEEKEKGKRIADHNTLLMKENKKAKTEDSFQTVATKIGGAIMFVLGFILPIQYNPSYKWGQDNSLSYLIMVGALVTFWPQIKKYGPRIAKLWKK